MQELKSLAGHFGAYLQTEVLPALHERYPKEIAEVVAYTLSAPGKRVRPALCLLASGYPFWQAVSGKAPKDRSTAENSDKRGLYHNSSKERAALQTALALECIHTYSLIHDDLPAMDNDDLRRGRPTAHRAFGEWQAILAGDALNTWAFELVASLPEEIPPSRALQMCLVLARAAGMDGMVGGQALDLYYEKNHGKKDTGGKDTIAKPDIKNSKNSNSTSEAQHKTSSQSKSSPKEILKTIHNKKTAALLSASCELGAILAGYEKTECEKYADYGRRLGLLFQIADDLLDVTGDATKMGKAVQKDAELGKWTYPSLWGLEASKREAEKLLSELKMLAEELRMSDEGPNIRSVWQKLPDFVYQRDH